MMTSAFNKLALLTCLLAYLSSMIVSADDNCTSIAEIACESDDFSTLCELISMSETVTETLTNEILTVFAPTDDAFAALDADLVSELVNCTESLNSVLAFHTVFGQALYSSDLVCSETVGMANGDNSRTICKDDKIYQKGSQNSRDSLPEVVAADIEACNGVIHVVDTVMLPKAKYLEFDECDSLAVVPEVIDVTPEEPVDPPVEPEPDCPSIVDIACGSADEFTTLCDLLTEFELAEPLSGGTWTVFAPTDAAFSAIEDIAADLTSDQIANILTFHAVSGQALMWDDLVCKELTEMATGESSRTKCKTDDEKGVDIKIQRGAGQSDDMLPVIVFKDIEACNGIIHVVNNVIIPRL